MSRSLLRTGTDLGAPVLPPAGTGAAVDGYSEAMPTAAQYGARVAYVGAARTYTTISAGITYAATLRTGTQRALVIVDPGSYTEQATTVPYVDLVGATADPADVVLHHPAPSGGSPLNTGGGPVYVGGITCRLDAGTHGGSGTYSWHHHGSDVTILELVLFDSEAGTEAGFGMDGDTGSLTYLIDCAATAGSTNLHGQLTNAEPLRFAVVRGTYALTFAYNDLESGKADELWLVGVTATSWLTFGTGVIVHTDGAVTEAGGSEYASRIISGTLPRLPIHGTA